MAIQTPDYLPAEYSDISWPDPSGIPDQGSGGGGDYAAQITALYQQYYHRDPTAAELAAWNEQLAKGVPLSTLEGQLQAATANQTGQSQNPSPTQTGPLALPADVQAWFMSLVNGKTPSLETFAALEPELAKYGVKLERNAAGQFNGNLILPNGQNYDVAHGNGSGGWDAWQWNLDMGNGGTSGTPITVDPSYLTPWTQQFQFEDFQAPTAEQAANEPGYQFAVGEGRKAIENSAAAKGLLNSGGTLTDLMGYGQKMGAQNYQSAFDRAWGMWNGRRSNAWQNFLEQKDSWYRNQTEPWNKLYQGASLGYNAASA